MKKAVLWVLAGLILVTTFTGCSKTENAITSVMPVIKAGAAKNESTRLTSAYDLKDKRIGVLLGSIHDSFATKTYPRATILQYRTPSDMVLAVKMGKVDAAFYQYENLLELLRSDNELDMLGKPLSLDPIAMGFNKNNDDLRKKFNEFLRHIKDE